MIRRALPLTVVLMAHAAACGRGNTAPTPAIPNVTGNYSGTVTITYQLTGGQISCPATTSVTQSGANVTLAPLTMAGACPSAGLSSFPVGDFTITNTGSLGTQSGTNLFVASCNGFYSYSASGGFFGSTLQFTFIYTATSGGCVSQVGNFTFAGNLSR